MSRYETVYKVTRKDCKSFVSERPYCLQYSEDHFTEGYRGTPVLAFRNLADAQVFKFNYGSPVSIIWRAVAQRPLRKVDELDAAHHHLAFWRRWSWFGLPRRAVDGFFAPRGTYACKAIRLVERVG